MEILTEEQKEKLQEASQLIQEVLEQFPQKGTYSQEYVSTSIREARSNLNQAIYRNKVALAD